MVKISNHGYLFLQVILASCSSIDCLLLEANQKIYWEVNEINLKAGPAEI